MRVLTSRRVLIVMAAALFFATLLVAAMALKPPLNRTKIYLSSNVL